MFDEVEDLNDGGMHHLGKELPFGHRDGLRLSIPGMHQAFEYHRSFVDVVIDSQIYPAQAAVSHAALDLVLVGDEVPGVELG